MMYTMLFQQGNSGFAGRVLILVVMDDVHDVEELCEKEQKLNSS